MLFTLRLTGLLVALNVFGIVRMPMAIMLAPIGIFWIAAVVYILTDRRLG